MPTSATTARTGLPALALALAAACASRGRPGADLPRELVRTTPPPLPGVVVPGAGVCAQRLRDPANGREYQLRGGPSGANGMGGGPGVAAGTMTAVGLYVPVSSTGGQLAVPLRVECGSLRVVGRA